MKLLVVEDQEKTISFLTKGLTAGGYVTASARTLSEAREMLAANDFDALIVDVNLPDGSGVDFVRETRGDGYRGAVIFLSALAATEFKVQGLDAGGDDYVTKPFSIDELLARLRAQLRSTAGPEGRTTLKAGHIEMDLVKRKVHRGGELLDLSVKEFALLEYFLRNPERPLSRALIAEHVWNVDFDSESNVIDVYINHLRKKLEANNSPRVIYTVTGIGYELRPAKKEEPD